VLVLWTSKLKFSRKNSENRVSLTLTLRRFRVFLEYFKKQEAGNSGLYFLMIKELYKMEKFLEFFGQWCISGTREINF